MNFRRYIRYVKNPGFIIIIIINFANHQSKVNAEMNLTAGYV